MKYSPEVSATPKAASNVDRDREELRVPAAFCAFQRPENVHGILEDRVTAEKICRGKEDKKAARRGRIIHCI